jgi:hypothetical protein
VPALPPLPQRKWLQQAVCPSRLARRRALRRTDPTNRAISKLARGKILSDFLLLTVNLLLLSIAAIVAAIDCDGVEAFLPLVDVSFIEKERSTVAIMAEPPEERPNGVNTEPNSTLVWAKVWDCLSPPPSNTMKVRCCLFVMCIFVVIIMSHPMPMFAGNHRTQSSESETPTLEHRGPSHCHRRGRTEQEQEFPKHPKGRRGGDRLL